MQLQGLIMANILYLSVFFLILKSSFNEKRRGIFYGLMFAVYLLVLLISIIQLTKPQDGHQGSNGGIDILFIICLGAITFLTAIVFIIMEIVRNSR